MKIWDSKLLNSKVDTEKIEKKEMFLGYLLGPTLMFLMTSTMSGTYLMQYYTDVVGIGGSLIIIMPIVSKILVALTNIIFSHLINNTKTRQGKARPWLLIAGILLPISGILLYMVPQASYKVQITWILFSYNFFFVIAFNIYSLAHQMMIPRSSRKTSERDKLTLFKNISEAMIPGTLSAVIMPFLVSKMGVGNAAGSNWFKMMLILSIIALPAALIEYYFTKERVGDSNNQTIPLFKQFKDSLKEKEWLIVMVLIGIKMIESGFMNNTMIYYCNWLLGNSIQSGARYQALFNVIGQFPLGVGVFILWPIIKKYGKYNAMKVGCLIAAIGSALVFFNSNNFVIVLVGMFIKSIGSIPTMMSVSMMSDVIDKIEKKNGYRFDSLGASMNSIMQNLSVGFAQTVILLCINNMGYIIPNSSEHIIAQPQNLLNFFNFAMAGIPMIGFIISFILVSQLAGKSTNIEKM